METALFVLLICLEHGLQGQNPPLRCFALHGRNLTPPEGDVASGPVGLNLKQKRRACHLLGSKSPVLGGGGVVFRLVKRGRLPHRVLHGINIVRVVGGNAAQVQVGIDFGSNIPT
jgi:hypothetical protein